MTTTADEVTHQISEDDHVLDLKVCMLSLCVLLCFVAEMVHYLTMMS